MGHIIMCMYIIYTNIYYIYAIATGYSYVTKSRAFRLPLFIS